MPTPMLTQEYLKSMLHYDPDTGVFRWRVGRPKRVAGSIAGYKNRENGYWRIKLLGRPFVAHRLIWLYLYNYMPDSIDHINGVRHDNRLANLRECTNSQNQYNSKHRNTISGHKGVVLAPSGRWKALIGANNKQIYGGTYTRKEDAIHAYRRLADDLAGQFALHNSPKTRDHGRDQ